MTVDGPVRIVGVHVPAYKNLKDLWLPWSAGVALIGANGAGKTNLLEVLAALMGTPETLARMRIRVDWPGAVGASVIVEGDEFGLPTPLTPELEHLEEDKLAKTFAHVFADREWWHAGGREIQTSHAEAWEAARIRYRLSSVEAVGNTVRRSFRRTLIVGDVRSPDAEIDLPSADPPPVDLQWLPTMRSSDEVADALYEEFTSSLPKVSRFVEALGRVLPTARPPQDDDGHWWLHEVAAAAGREELTLTTSNVSVESEGGGNACWYLLSGAVNIGRTDGETPVLERLSSGQRRWADEALATMGRELRVFGARLELFKLFLARVDEAELQTAVAKNLDSDARIEAEEFWDADALSAFLRVLDPILIGLVRALPLSDLHRRQVNVLIPELASLETRIVVRVVDEPEAHLHPGAQRKVAKALTSLRNQGADLVIASHSPTFLGLRDWQALRVDGGTVEPIDGLDAPARTRVADDLGITQGELLAGISALLVVEGDHDLLVLQELFGPQLRAAGVAIARMQGTERILNVLELDFIIRYVKVPPIVMLDYTSAGRVNRRQASTQEEKKAVELLDTAVARGLECEVLALSRPDIVCYLNEEVISESVPAFPGWDHVSTSYRKSYKRHKDRPSFKPWLRDGYGVALEHENQIREVLDRMRALRLPSEGELVRKVNELLAKLG